MALPLAMPVPRMYCNVPYRPEGAQPATRMEGSARPGIIHGMSAQLAQYSVSIDKLKTHIASGAMSGEQMFHMNAQLTVPVALDTDALRAGLESLANELMVDITFDSGAALA